MRRLIFCILAVCIGAMCAFPAGAQELLFSRETLNIATVRQPPAPPEETVDKAEEEDGQKKEAGEKKESPSTEPVITRLPFLVEVQPYRATRVDWFSNRQPLTEGRGILLVFEDADTDLSLRWSNVTSRYDVLFILKTGRIQTVVPDLALSELSEPMEISGNIAAVLYLAGGTTKAKDILPGDRVEFRLFNPAPVVMQ